MAWWLWAGWLLQCLGCQGHMQCFIPASSCLTRMELQCVNSFTQQEKSSASGVWSCVIFTLLLKRERQMLPKEFPKQIAFLLLVGLVSDRCRAPPFVLSLRYALPALGSRTIYKSVCTSRKIFYFCIFLSKSGWIPTVCFDSWVCSALLGRDGEGRRGEGSALGQSWCLGCATLLPQPLVLSLHQALSSPSVWCFRLQERKGFFMSLLHAENKSKFLFYPC